MFRRVVLSSVTFFSAGMFLSVNAQWTKPGSVIYPTTYSTNVVAIGRNTANNGAMLSIQQNSGSAAVSITGNSERAFLGRDVLSFGSPGGSSDYRNGGFSFNGSGGEFSFGATSQYNINIWNRTRNAYARLGSNSDYECGYSLAKDGEDKWWWYMPPNSNDLRISTNTEQRVVFCENGNVGIGTMEPGSYKLAVEGKIGAREIVVTTAAWADYVFKPDYKLKPLNEVEEFIKTNSHLEGIPTEKEVKAEGVALGDMQVKLLKKVEELTLYVIQQQKEIETLKGMVGNNKSKN